MIKNDSVNHEQRLLIINADGSSRLLNGDADERPLNSGNEDMLPSYLSMGWKVLNATPFHDCSDVLILIQRELRN